MKRKIDILRKSYLNKLFIKQIDNFHYIVVYVAYIYYKGGAHRVYSRYFDVLYGTMIYPTITTCESDVPITSFIEHINPDKEADEKDIMEKLIKDVKFVLGKEE